MNLKFSNYFVLVFRASKQGIRELNFTSWFRNVWIVAVSLECVNVCKPWKGDGSGRYDCSVLSCAWKAPRVLTGFLASTAHPPQCSWLPYARNGRRNRINNVSSLCIYFLPLIENQVPWLEIVSAYLDFGCQVLLLTSWHVGLVPRQHSSWSCP